MIQSDKKSEAAYLALKGKPEDFKEANVGFYKSDEEFAEKVARDMGEIPDDNHWPHCHINWVLAAKQLMEDYEKQDGYYFKKM